MMMQDKSSRACRGSVLGSLAWIGFLLGGAALFGGLAFSGDAAPAALTAVPASAQEEEGEEEEGEEEEGEEEEHGGNLVFHVVSRSQKFSVLYSHQAHLDAGIECEDCHEEIFKKEFQANHFKMSDINKGKACGVCHNSSPEEGVKSAFAPRKNCAKCHVLRVREPEKRKR